MDSKESLQAYLANARSILSNFESALGWQPPVFNGIPDHVDCPLDIGHSIPEGRLESHVKLCKWRKCGYSEEEIRDILDQEDRTKTQSDPAIINYDHIIAQIVPSAGLIRSDERLKVKLSPEERLAVYEAEVSKCYGADKPLPDKALYADLEAKAAEKLYQKENPENLSQVELLQKVRDLKRRRQSYRAKNVHITKRSQTEIVRGVLEVHMEELRKMWSPEQPQSMEEPQVDGRKGKRLDEGENKSGDHNERGIGHQYKPRNSRSGSPYERAGRDAKRQRKYESPSTTKRGKAEDREKYRLTHLTQESRNRLPFHEMGPKSVIDRDFADHYEGHSMPNRPVSSDEDERHKRRKKSKKHKSRY